MKVDFQTLFKAVIAIVVIGVFMILAQLWFDIFPQFVFWKLLATLGLLGGLIGFLIAIKQDIADEKKLRDDKYIQ